METHSAAWAVPRVLGAADVSHIVAAGIAPRPRAMGADPYEPYLQKTRLRGRGPSV